MKSIAKISAAGLTVLALGLAYAAEGDGSAPASSMSETMQQMMRGATGKPSTEPGGAARGQNTRGVEEMHRFMASDRMPRSMNAMMTMAERMGGGDTMLGMVRMMEMMSMMGSSGMMDGASPGADR